MNIYIYVLVMAVVTYLIRAIPLTAFRRKIENPILQSFLYYVPYACLTAMTVPGMLYATAGVFSALAGLAVAIVLALHGKSLLTVAASACLAVFLVERLPMFG